MHTLEIDPTNGDAAAESAIARSTLARSPSYSSVIAERLEALGKQVAFLVERQEQRSELYDELAPVLRAMMSTLTGRLDAVEKRGWFAFGGALADVAERILDHYTAADVHALGDAVVTILDTVRTLTQPEVLALLGKAGEALQHADEARPVGLFGTVRATHDSDVKKGTAVMLEVLRHVGRAASAMAAQAQPVLDRKARLTAVLGPRRRPATSLTAGDAGQAQGAVTHAVPPTEVAAVVGAGAGAEVLRPWTRALAEELAAAEGIGLGVEHWKLVDLARQEFAEKKTAANIRRLTQISGVSTKDIYALFPRAPGRTIARIAGTPKPAGCI